VFQIRDGQLREITNDHTIGILVWTADLLALMLTWHLDGRQTVGPIWASGPTAAICCSPADSARLRTTDRSGMYSFPRRFRRGVG
jgi:hypothetical protein